MYFSPIFAFRRSSASCTSFMALLIFTPSISNASITSSSSSNIADSPWLAEDVVELVLADDVEGREDAEDREDAEGREDAEDRKMVELVQLDVEEERAELRRCTEACTWLV